MAHSDSQAYISEVDEKYVAIMTMMQTSAQAQKSLFDSLVATVADREEWRMGQADLLTKTANEAQGQAAQLRSDLEHQKSQANDLSEEVKNLKSQLDTMKQNHPGSPGSTGQSMLIEPYKDGVYTYFSTTVDAGVLFPRKPVGMVMPNKDTVPKLLNLFGLPESLKTQAKIQIKTAKDSKYSCAPFSTYEDDKMMFCVYMADDENAAQTVHYIGKFKPTSTGVTQNKHPETLHGNL